jgi:cytochrome b561
MPFSNSKSTYGWFSIGLHWLMAAGVFGLFILGFLMVDFDYYSPWYNRAPHLHESLGILFAVLLLLRLVARWINPPPGPLGSLSPLERTSARAVHRLFYVLMFAIVVSGYLVSSAGDRAVPVFDWFSVPALSLPIDQQQDIAGKWHRWIGWSLVIVGGLHGLAAIKHHLIDRDRTLRRILGL